MTLTEKIAKLKAWSAANYERGADTFVECWDDTDYERLIAEHNGSPRAALRTLRACASVYRERQADAAFHANA